MATQVVVLIGETPLCLQSHNITCTTFLLISKLLYMYPARCDDYPKFTLFYAIDHCKLIAILLNLKE